MRTARSRTSGEKRFDLLIAPSSQRLEPPQNTGRFTDMQEFIEYSSQTSKEAMPADSMTVSDFLMSAAATGIKNSTVRRKAASISAVHRLLNYTDPTKHPEVKITLRKISRNLGCRFEQAYPVTRPVLDQLIKACSQDLRGLRNKALLLTAYDSLRRRSELVSLCLHDIDWLPNQTCSVLLRKSKTDQQGSGKWIHLGAETTLAIREWISESKIIDGHILRGVHPSGEITPSLCESRIPRIYKSLAKRAHLCEEAISGISGHSMRVGRAQDLMIQGASLPQIMVKGGWAKTDTVMRYIERIRTSSIKNLALD
jgi:site-specific recombinase XerD